MEIPVHADGVLIWQGRRMRCALGRGGVAAAKCEGDSTTPTGVLPLRRLLYRPDRMAPPETRLPTAALAKDDGWCDDPRDPLYNQAVKLPFGGRHEELWRADALYDVIVVLGHNDDPPHPNLGSAIFMHIAAADYGPTEGCVALALDDLFDVVAGCGTEARLRVSPD
jgi:L,D-peptidoglycan transpeptidase YkuD (ErfK/YbiS/YcfS/YnhG family)